MKAGENKLDDLDLFLHSHIGKWVILTWRDDLFRPPMQQAYGSHLATFIVCRHGDEIRGLNFSWLYRENDNQIYRVGDLLTGINNLWFFKYSTLRKFDSAPLHPHEVDFLQLPDLSQSSHTGLSDEVIQIRADACLNSFRHPGYPDDVVVNCGPRLEISEFSPAKCGELVWVRISRRKGHNHWIGEMLNQPRFFSWEKGQEVNVHLIKDIQGSILICANP